MHLLVYPCGYLIVDITSLSGSFSLSKSAPKSTLPSPSFMRLLLWVYIVACVALRANASFTANLKVNKTLQFESLAVKTSKQDARDSRRFDDTLTTADEERMDPVSIPSHLISIPLVDSNPSHSIPSLESSSSHSIPSSNSLPFSSSFNSIKVAALDKAVEWVDVSKKELPYKTEIIFTLFRILGVKPFTICWRRSFDAYWIKVASTYEQWLATKGPLKKVEANGKDLHV